MVLLCFLALLFLCRRESIRLECEVVDSRLRGNDGKLLCVMFWCLFWNDERGIGFNG